MADSKKNRPSAIPRRTFLQLSAGTVGVAGTLGLPTTQGADLPFSSSADKRARSNRSGKRSYNSEYSGPNLNRVAFPLGGIGAGMLCLEGTGALSHVSFRNKPDVFNEPLMFA